ncbi:cytochrome P450 [Nocardia nova]|jgi:cytochrome P450|uniref:cytochrome P450 n=1 Tax=Nocardia nova TaxID=37330 RepID=UPI00189461E8|nr:cytochrome P450 [Nocardia nova]MBF6146165.1 cytochrome P450 [Nocardia nova]MDN2499909.1 cytochrome P450 [Nocardia nova]
MTTVFPPGPRLPRVAQTLLHAKWRGWFAGVASRRYGDVYTMRMIAPYAENLVVFSRPEHIREIFAGAPADLHAGEGNRVLEPVMGQHSLLLTDEDEHARARRLLMPAFTGSALRGYRDLVEAIAKHHIDQWQPDTTLVTLPRMNELTLDVIMQVVFGISEQRGRADLAPRLRYLVDVGPLIFLGWKWHRLQRFGPWKRFADNKNAIDALLYEEIARRRDEADPGERADVLARLLAVGAEAGDEPLSDAELRDQLVTLLLAGHETTASALSWAMFELAAHPEVQQRARRAAAEGDDKYLEAVLKEAMRRHPVIGGTLRRLTRETTIGGYTLPRGTVVQTSIVLAHANPDNHPEPESFRPERFLDGSVAANTWLPFGGGVRRCIGAGFSLMEGTAVLSEVLSRFALAPVRTHERGRIRNITNVPAHGAPVLLRPHPGTL